MYCIDMDLHRETNTITRLRVWWADDIWTSCVFRSEMFFLNNKRNRNIDGICATRINGQRAQT